MYFISSCSLCISSVAAPCVFHRQLLPVYFISSCFLWISSAAAPCVFHHQLLPVYFITSCFLCIFSSFMHLETVGRGCAHSVHHYFITSCFLCISSPAASCMQAEVVSGLQIICQMIGNAELRVIAEDNPDVMQVRFIIQQSISGLFKHTYDFFKLRLLFWRAALTWCRCD